MSDADTVPSNFQSLPVPPKDPRFTPKLNAAICEAQKLIFNPKKNREVEVESKTGAKFGYEYAELCTVTEILRLPLANNGLSYFQTITFENDRTFVLTELFHESGEYRLFRYPLIPTSQGTQEKAMAGGYTYGKRQALKGIFGIADDTEDKDGNENDPSATVKDKGAQKGKTQAPPPGKPPGSNKAPASRPGGSVQKPKGDAHPSDFVIPKDFGDVSGARLGNLNETTMRKLKAWCEDQKKADKKPSNLGDVILVSAKIDSFFESVGVPK